jgi:hypothetical protein
MSSAFQFAGGSFIGKHHRENHLGNQDAWTMLLEEDLSICIVADGCGSGANSEVGSNIGARLIARSLREEYRRSEGAINWDRLQRHVVAQLDQIVWGMSGDTVEEYVKTVTRFFLFTVIGCIIDRSTVTFFGLGDGTIAVNGTPITFGPFPENKPPYIGYNLVLEYVEMDAEQLRLAPLVETFDVSKLHSFMLATDGIDDLDAHSELTRPGLSVPVGPVSQFWEKDRFFNGNPIIIDRELKLIGRDWPEADPQPGLLEDDTTLIVGRRVPEPETE